MTQGQGGRTAAKAPAAVSIAIRWKVDSSGCKEGDLSQKAEIIVRIRSARPITRAIDHGRARSSPARKGGKLAV